MVIPWNKINYDIKAFKLVHSIPAMLNYFAIINLSHTSMELALS